MVGYVCIIYIYIIFILYNVTNIYIYIHVCTILEIKTIMSMSLRGQPLEHIFEDESTVHLHGLEFRW